MCALSLIIRKITLSTQVFCRGWDESEYPCVMRLLDERFRSIFEELFLPVTTLAYFALFGLYFVQSQRDIGPTSERCLGGESLQTSHCQTGTAFLLLGTDTSVLQRFLAEPVVELQTRFDPPAAGHPVVPDFGTAGS